MVYRDRQGLSPTGDPIQLSNNRDRYLDNCFLLCINRDDDTDVPEIRRLENDVMRDLCDKNQIKPQQQSKLYIQDQRRQPTENYDYDDEDIIRPSKQTKVRDYAYRRKDNQYDRESQLIANRSKYQRDDTIDNYYANDQYTRPGKYNHRDNYNIIQHSDDELSVYEVYVPTNTLNRLGDKRTGNNMVLIDYEDVSMLRDIRGPSSPYGYPPQNLSSQYNNYSPVNQYPSDLTRDRDGQQQFYQNTPLQQQQQLNNYYVNEGDRPPYSPQSGPFVPTDINHSNAINIRRHIYSPSQLPQGLTEGQLVMLLQKGSQYQQHKCEPTTPPTQLFPSHNEVQPTVVTLTPQVNSMPNTNIEALKTPAYVASTPIKMPQVPTQLVDHQIINDDKISIVDEITKPMSTLNTRTSIKISKELESREESRDKKKDSGGDHKKDSKKEKSSGKDSKKKKK
ncbi:unnamed protein product [Rotaria socialis]|uniref:Uncharacterized protein n=1 Tax=Rotaria socialis TaxID=392032 RepID=A0A817U831_9BILA|nr:unnamed protein product [Rotaria socialis]CAF3322597.1 unnamed protein product [Rotaria socialis]CAF3323348.1 unnamed protein product [Rotaria socialis]CAF3666453.1 unnamed protein product [Rotaria socialis]